jgi:hypothetical protein
MEIREKENYDTILEMRELAYKGMTEKVVEEINCLDLDFFNQNPILLFQLKQVLQSLCISFHNSTCIFFTTLLVCFFSWLCNSRFWGYLFSFDLDK